MPSPAHLLLQRFPMTYRTPILARPWLDGAAYDKYTGERMVHYDLYAWHEGGYYYLEIKASVSGKTPLAWSMYRYEPVFGVLAPVAWGSKPDALRPVIWDRRTRDMFNRVHARLIGQCVTPHGYTNKTILAHYVARSDADPWPRGATNTYREPVYVKGKPGRPKKVLVDLADVL